MTSLESDFRRMISNAKSFNIKASQVSSDAEKIRKMVQVFMIENNPAYKTPGYQPAATPIPEKSSKPSPKEEELSEVEADREAKKEQETGPEPEGAGNGLRSSRRSGRAIVSPAVTASDNREGSSTPAALDAAGAGESFEKNTLQQAQDKIITEMMNLTDDKYVDVPAMSTPFANPMYQETIDRGKFHSDAATCFDGLLQADQAPCLAKEYPKARPGVQRS